MKNEGHNVGSKTAADVACINQLQLTLFRVHGSATLQTCAPSELFAGAPLGALLTRVLGQLELHRLDRQNSAFF